MKNFIPLIGLIIFSSMLFNGIACSEEYNINDEYDGYTIQFRQLQSVTPEYDRRVQQYDRQRYQQQQQLMQMQQLQQLQNINDNLENGNNSYRFR
jgi:hypothetical protein